MDLQKYKQKTREAALRAGPGLMKVFAIYAVVIALLNLGTLSFPTTVYRGEAGDSFTLDFGEVVEIDEVWINGIHEH